MLKIFIMGKYDADCLNNKLRGLDMSKESKENDSFINKYISPIISVLSLSVSIVALIFSYDANKISNESNKIASESNKIASESNKISTESNILTKRDIIRRKNALEFKIREDMATFLKK